MRILLVLLLLSVTAEAKVPRGRGRCHTKNGASRTCGVDGSVFRLLKTSNPSSSINTIDQNFCSTYSAYITGSSSYCLSGDGTNTGLALTEVGPADNVTDSMCPNGPDCTAITSQRTGTGKRFESAAAAFGPSTLSVCAFVSPDAINGATQRILSKDDGSAKRTYNLSITGAGAFAYGVYATGSASAGGGTAVVGSWQFVCLTYSTGASKLYIDGAQSGATGTGATGAILSYSDTKHAIGADDNGNGPFFGRIALAFVTEQELDASTIAAMNTSLRATLTGSRGETITVSRSTIRSSFTSNNGWAGSILGANRPSVHNSALGISGAVTNLLQQSDAVSTAPWTSSGVTTDAVISPYGTLTADTLTDSSAVGSSGINQAVATTIGTVYTMSCYVKPGTFSSVRLVMQGVTGATAVLSSGWNRATVTGTASATSTTFSLSLPNVADMGTIHIAGCQVNTGSTALSYCPTTTASATCNGDKVGVSTSTWPAPTGDWSISMNWTPSTASYPSLGYLFEAGGTTNGINIYAGTTTVRLRVGGTEIQGGAPTAGAWAAGTTYRIRATGSGTTATLYIDGTQNLTGTVTAPTAWDATAYIGSFDTGTAQASGLFSDVCVDDSLTGCR